MRLKIFVFLLLFSFCLTALGQINNKQANTVGSEICVDAPYHMQKYDDSENINSVPIHVFVHGSNAAGSNNELMNVRIKIKNASDTEFSQLISFNDYSEEDFSALFVNKSQYNEEFDIQAFDESLPIRSDNATIDFIADSHTFPATTYTDITQDFWWFTILIPADKLVGYENVIDIEVYCELDWDPDYTAYLRVFRQEDDFPRINNWLRGDVHYHGIYTQNDAEVGLPLDATKLMAKYCGLDWITLTDHSCDYDNSGLNENSNWSDLGGIVEELNTDDNSFVFIRGIEMTVKNSANNHIHALTYPSANNPLSMPYFGDGGGDLTATDVNVDALSDSVSMYDAFVYAAHPFAEGDELSFAVDGSVWNLSDSDFIENGQAHQYIGEVLCNDLGNDSDIFSNEDNKLLKDGIVGGQIWNMSNFLKTTEAEDPWDSMHQGNDCFELFPIEDVEHTTSRFMQNLEVVDFIWKKGLHEKNLNNDLINWKFYISAGSDAHGAYNYSTTDLFMGVSGFVSDNAIGKFSSLVYCPDETGNHGQNVLSAMKQGNLILSSGPIVALEIDTDDGNSIPEIIIGNNAELSLNNAQEAILNLYAISSDEYGDVVRKQLIIKTETQDVVIDLSNDEIDLQQNLLEILEANFSNSSDYLDQWILIRAELETQRDGLDLNIYKRTQQEFYSYTNPIWIKIVSPTDKVEKDITKFNVYPNPAENYFIIILNDENSQNTLIEICNSTGDVILKENIKNNQKVNTSEFAPGVYFINISGTRRKLIVY